MATGVEVNGIKEGKWFFYYENSEVYKEINFLNGVEDGECKMWHENGNPYLVQYKKNGQTTGIWKEYYENGRIKEVGEYINGEYFPYDFWNEEGQQLLKEGTGKKIEKFGHLELDIVEQYYSEGRFIREEKVSSAQYGSFNPQSKKE